MAAAIPGTPDDKKGILLETGTNEFEIVEFSIGDVDYGINVAKVREVIQSADFPVTTMPQAHPYIDGLFTLRGRSMPLVNLPRCLNVQGAENPKNIIVTEINNYNLGFLVDSVSRIHRISWKEMEPAPEVGDQSRVVGIVKMHGKIVLLIDFETIIAEINPEINAKLTTFEDAASHTKEMRGMEHIVIAEDSPMLRDLLITTLHESGYNFVKGNSNGKDAWEYLMALADRSEPIEKLVSLVVTDIEMPQMDGHRLLKLIRTNERLRNVPVILFSSLINEEMRVKGDQLGASGQISKPEINQLIGMMDSLIFGEDAVKKSAKDDWLSHAL